MIAAAWNLKKKKYTIIFRQHQIYIYIYIYILCAYRCNFTCVYLHVNETTMTDWANKDSTYLWHNRLCVFLFLREKPVLQKHLTQVASNVRAIFTCTLNPFCLSMQRQFTNYLCVLSCSGEYFRLVPLSPFIRHPLSKFTLGPSSWL